MNNRWRRIITLDDLSYACTVSETDYSIMVFNSVMWGVVALDNHTESEHQALGKETNDEP